MNVGFENPFRIIGSTDKDTHHPHLLKISIRSELPAMPFNSFPKAFFSMTMEIYKIGTMAHPTQGRQRFIKVKEFQNIKPLKVKPFCELF